MTAEQCRVPQPHQGPNCWACRHLMITWDVRKPYGCKLMGFKSKVLPSVEVLRADGRFCGGFLAKPDAKDSIKAENKVHIKPTLSVGKSSDRQDSDPPRRWMPVNLIT